MSNAYNKFIDRLESESFPREASIIRQAISHGYHIDDYTRIAVLTIVLPRKMEFYKEHLAIKKDILEDIARNIDDDEPNMMLDIIWK